jgi:ABC-2 type transport system permease protein
MKTISIIIKGFKEQIRSYWVLLLTLSMGPFFIFVYFLITESSKAQYHVLIQNNDPGVTADGQQVNYGDDLITYFKNFGNDTMAIPFTVEETASCDEAIEQVKNKDADALIIIHDSFSRAMEKRKINDSAALPGVEFVGDLTSTNYLISAVWANEIVNRYAMASTFSDPVIEVKETALGSSASADSFDILVPGLLIISLIMLMFTASIAFVSEVENKTIMRLKLSKLTTFEFLGGIGIVQLVIGIISLLLTLLTASGLGFHFTGSVLIVIVVAGLTSLSIISFSLIIAAFTKSANEVLVVGNFPMFLFMFFSGAAFPLKSKALFTIAGYPVSIQGLMSPTHAISALNKTLIMNMDISGILPEIGAITILTLIYFLIGGILFKNRHLKLT